MPVEFVENGSKTTDTNGLPGKFWWLSLIRGVVALLLGIALLLIPITGKHLLVRYMGIYRRYRFYNGRHQAEGTSPCDQVTGRVEILGDEMPVRGGVGSL